MGLAALLACSESAAAACGFDDDDDDDDGFVVELTRGVWEEDDGNGEGRDDVDDGRDAALECVSGVCVVSGVRVWVVVFLLSCRRDDEDDDCEDDDCEADDDAS